MVAAELRPLLNRLERADGDANDEDLTQICKELLRVARQWPVEASSEDLDCLDRLAEGLPCFPDPQQQEIVAAFRPLRDGLRRKVIDATSALNKWLSEAREYGRASAGGRLADLLSRLLDSYSFCCYKQCPDVLAKANLLMACASVARAVQDERGWLNWLVSEHRRALQLVQQLVDRLFVLPGLGADMPGQNARPCSVLTCWHEARLERYNRIFNRAGRRAVERLKDALQVRLVSAVRRAAESAHEADPSKALKLEVELRSWPMTRCPLACSFVDFVNVRNQELGDVGSPGLSECPPHTLRPRTLIRLLGRLEAFDILPPESGRRGAPGIVRLRRQAVAALTSKAVGTKPKAACQPSPSPGSSTGHVTGLRGESDLPFRNSEVDGAPRQARAGSSRQSAISALRIEAVRRRIESRSGAHLVGLINTGLKQQDRDWHEAWGQFCRQRRISMDPHGHSHAILAEFVKRNFDQCARKVWAKEILYGSSVAAGQGRHSDSEASASRKRKGDCSALVNPSSKGSGQSDRRGRMEEEGHELSSATQSSSDADDRRKRARTGSSSQSESTQNRKGRKRRDKKKMLIGYGDYFRGRRRKMSQEAMLMNQMMGMSIMMSNPLAMMGMGAQMLPGSLSVGKKEDKAARREDKFKREVFLARDYRDNDGASSVVSGASSRRGKEPAVDRGRRQSRIDTDDL